MLGWPLRRHGLGESGQEGGATLTAAALRVRWAVAQFAEKEVVSANCIRARAHLLVVAHLEELQQVVRGVGFTCRGVVEESEHGPRFRLPCTQAVFNALVAGEGLAPPFLPPNESGRWRGLPVGESMARAGAHGALARWKNCPRRISAVADHP